MKAFTDMMDKIDALSVRERAAIFIALLAVIFFVWDSYLMSSLNNKEKILRSQLQQKQTEQMTLNAELQILIGKRQNATNDLNKQKLNALREQLNQVESELLESTKHMIPPKRMAVVLEDVLQRTQGLELIQVKGLGSKALVSDKKQETSNNTNAKSEGDKSGPEGSDGMINAYKHGLQIVFKGSFSSTLEYVKRLEELESEFIWDSLQLEISDYPGGRASITVFTLSLDRNWIGV